MADGVELDPGSGGVTIATDDDGTFHWPYTKLVFGANNTQTIVESISSNPLPVALSATDNAVLDAIAASVAGTLTVGAHAVTNAGTFAVQVDGSALTSLQLADDVVYVDDADWTDNTSKHTLVGGVYQSSPHTVTDGDVTPFLTDVNGRLSVVDSAAGTLLGTIDSDTSAIVTSVQLLDDAVFADDAAFTHATSKGVVMMGTYQSSPNTLDDNDAGAILLDASHRVVLAPGAAEKVDDAQFTPGTTGVVMIGLQADEAATDSVDEGDAGCPRMTLTRKAIVTTQPHTSGGCTPFYNLDVDESEDAIKASAGQLYELQLINRTTGILYVKLYDATTGNTTVGSTTPVMTIPVPANADSDGAGVVRNWPNGLNFANAITIAATTGFADNDTGAPGANDIIACGAYF